MALNDSLKQRIIGAVVLISCAVIFIPMVFDPKTAELVELNSSIPNTPPMPTVNIKRAARPKVTKTIHVEPRQSYRLIEAQEDAVFEEVDRPPREETVLDGKSQPVGSANINQSIAKGSRILGIDGLPKAWVVQVASFKGVERAKSLRNKLLDQGYRAFIRSSSIKGTDSNRVYVGPKLDKALADGIKQKLDKDLKLTSMVLRFKAEG